MAICERCELSATNSQSVRLSYTIQDEKTLRDDWGAVGGNDSGGDTNDSTISCMRFNVRSVHRIVQAIVHRHRLSRRCCQHCNRSQHWRRLRHRRWWRWQRRRCKFLFTRACHVVANENVATIGLAYIVCNYLLVLAKQTKANSLH